MTGRVDGHLLDRVSVTGIEARGRHGVFDHEKAEGQVFRADVTLHLDARRAWASDDLADAVDYGAVAAGVHAVLAGPARDLVETVAGEIALGVLRDHPRVAAVDVTVHKPQAPVGVPFADVAVALHRTRDDLAVATPPGRAERAVLALGSNLGDRAGMLAGAVHALARSPGIEVQAVSPVYRTDPVGGPDQPAYLNAVATVRTTLAPLALLHACQDAEAEHGRERRVRWGPRTLDVDVVSYGDVVADTAALALPHPRAHQRAFVLVPWHDLDASVALPAQITGLARRDDVRLPGTGTPAGTRA